MKTRTMFLGLISLLAMISVPVSAQDHCLRPDKPVNTQPRDKTLNLQWKSPEPVYGIFDDFESHPDFAINSPGEVGWQYLDLDKEPTYGPGINQWENRGNPSAFQVFNASKTIPEYTGVRGVAHSGKKMLLSFATLSDKRNDWIISPDLSSFGFTDSVRLGFYARTFNEIYGIEQIRVGYSETTATPGDFQWYNNGELIDVPYGTVEHPDMYYFEFAFPSTARYVAINCVTTKGLALCLDDITIASNKVLPNKSAHNYLLGYNVYRNGEKINAELIKKTSYQDIVPDYGNYSYQIEAVYEECVSEKSEALLVNVPDIHQLPLVDHFDSYDLETNYWETEPDTNHYWKIDWVDGGLIDPAATFRPSPGLTNYDNYCLISKELDATQLSGVMLSYDLSSYFYIPSQGMTLETLCAEVYNGEKWVKIKTHTSLNGSFGYERFYHDISSHVAGKKFRIRFRASGEKALHVIAWYLSYIKVHEIQKAQIDGTLTCNGIAAQGATIIFTSQDNDIYTAQTDAGGKYSISIVDTGEYTITATLDGANPFSKEMSINQGNHTIDIAMVKPEINLSLSEIDETLAAEEEKDITLQFSNSGQGSAKAGFWIHYDQEATGLKPQLKAIKTFRPSDLMQAGICFDGTYFYMGSQYDNFDGAIWKYDREGNFIESFVPNIHVRRYYGMAFDGLYFYVATGDNRIRIMDFSERRVVGEISTDITEIKHITYNSDQDAFYVGGINTIALVDRSGKTIVPETTLENSFTGTAYDPYFEKGPSLWIFDQSVPYNDDNRLNLATIRRLDLSTMQIADDYVFPCEYLDGYVHGKDNIPTWGVGLYGSTNYIEGHFVLMGTIISDPGLAFVVDMYTLPDWARLKEESTVFQPEGTYDLSLKLDAEHILDGQNRTATLYTRTDPGSEVIKTPIRLSVSGKAPHAHPLDLQVEIISDNAAHLTFKAPESDNQVEKYYIYRNNLKIDSTQDLQYEDPVLKAGDYTYAISALYTDGVESSPSKSVSIHIEVGSPCYRPHRLQATNVDNTAIHLEWLDPSVNGIEATDLRWDKGINDDGIGLFSGGVFLAASKWTPSDLENYRDMPIESVSFVPMHDKASYSLFIYEGEEVVLEQKISDFVSNTFNTIKLDKSLKINDRKDLIVAIRTETTDDGVLVIGVDAGPAVDGKGNLISFGEGWSTLLAQGGSDANFNISLHLLPKEDIDSDQITCDGFHIYRNGNRLTQEPVYALEYTDTDLSVGDYTYQVSAVYPNCESYLSNSAKASIMDLSSVSEPMNLDAIITMNRQVDLFWNSPRTRAQQASSGSKSGSATNMVFDYVDDFKLKSTGEIAIATDGESIYSTYWNRDGEFNRYDMEGNFIESFVIEGLGAIYDLTYDGEYFYGGADEPRLFCLDLKNKKLLKEISVTVPVRHCAYIPDLDNGRGGFEIGEYTSSFFVTRNGAYIDRGVSGLDGAFGSAYHDGKLYYSLQSAENKCEMVEYDFETLEKTGKSMDLTELVMLDLPKEARAGGLSVIANEDGSGILLASIQMASPETNRLAMISVGKNDYVKGYHIYRDGERINQEIVPGRGYRDTLTQEGSYEYYVSAIQVDGTESRYSDTLTIEIFPSTDCSAPIGLNSRVSGRDVTLSWTSAGEAAYQGDDMEGYDHMGESEDWILADKDGKTSAYLQEFTYGKEGKINGFMFTDQKSLASRQNGLAFSGDMMLMAVAPAVTETSEMTYANDWAIYRLDHVSDTPVWLSLMAKGLETAKTESFRIAYSTTDSSISNMIYLATEPSTVKNLYQRFVYEIPAKARFVAVNYTSGNGKALFIDDFGIHSSNVFEVKDKIRPGETLQDKVVGYYVYRNGELLTPEPVKGNSFFDANLENGDYVYTVKALYNTSCESTASEECPATVSYQAPANPPVNLQANVNNKDVELKWEAPLYDMDKLLSYAVTDMSSAYMEAEEATYYVASRWDASDLMGVFGYQLHSVTAAFYSQPNRLELLIYQEDELIYSKEVTQECTDIVSTFILDYPLDLDLNKSLTVGFAIQAGEGAPTIVVDNGPAVTYKGDLYSQDGKDWISGYVYMGYNTNWCIVANFRYPMPIATGQSPLEGFRLFRDKVTLADGIHELNYTDRNLPAGKYQYTVGAVYENGQVARSENILVEIQSGTGNSQEDGIQIWIGPNPATSSLYIQGIEAKAELCHPSGKVLKREFCQGSCVINVENIPSGLYLLKLTQKDGSLLVYKIMVM